MIEVVLKLSDRIKEITDQADSMRRKAQHLPSCAEKFEFLGSAAQLEETARFLLRGSTLANVSVRQVHPNDGCGVHAGILPGSAFDGRSSGFFLTLAAAQLQHHQTAVHGLPVLNELPQVDQRSDD